MMEKEDYSDGRGIEKWNKRKTGGIFGGSVIVLAGYSEQIANL
jgi:hypothetical protein